MSADKGVMKQKPIDIGYLADLLFPDFFFFGDSFLLLDDNNKIN